MFDDHVVDSGMDFSKAKKKAGTAEDRLPVATEPKEPKRHPLDSNENVRMWKRLMGFHLHELARQEENRAEMALDEEFYDNKQWDDTDAKVLEDRGQVPLVYNVTAPMVNWITGTQKRSRADFKVLPRRKDASKPAERKTQLLKYLDDVNRSAFTVSRAFEDSVKAGVGWVEAGFQDDDDGEPVYDRYESWRNLLWDSASTERDLRDCRFMSRSKWIDLDVAESLAPDRKGIINASIADSDRLFVDSVHGDDAMDSIEIEDFHTGQGREIDSTYSRERVRAIEVWFKKPIKVQRLRRGDFAGEVYDPEHPGHADEVESGRSIVVSKVMMRMHVAIMTTKGLLWISESPYRHNDFPFTPIWCYRRARNNLPYGVIRGVRDIQKDINKRAAKALAILSSNKTIMDEGAVPDLDEYAEEVANPNAIIVKKKGYELTIDADRELAPAHLDLMSRSIQMVQSVSGVTDENMGRSTNAKSGVAIERRQTQGSLVTSGIFDNLRFASQLIGEKKLSLIEQFFTEEKSFRITNMRGAPEYVDINDGLPENDIVRSKADFIISEDDWRASVREAQTEALMELLQQIAPVAPNIVMVMLDLLVEKMDIPNRDEIVRRIRQVTGATDPDQETPTPEDQARAAEQARQKQLQDAMVQAELAEKQAGAALKGAQAQKLQSDAQVSAKQALAAIANQNVASQKAALEAALAMLAAPPAVPVADGLLHEAGFKSRTEDEDDANLQAAVERQASLDQAANAQAQEAQAAAEQPMNPQGGGEMPTQPAQGM